MKTRAILLSLITLALTLGGANRSLLRAQDADRNEERRPPGDTAHREGPRREAPPRGERTAELRREIEELHRSGHHEEAERLEQRLGAGRDRRRGPENTGREPNPDQAIHELHRRLHHLEVAIENLRVADFHDPAEALERQAQHLREELERRAHRPGPGPEDRPPRQGPEMEDLARQVQDMREQLEEVHRALREIRGRLEQREPRP